MMDVLVKIVLESLWLLLPAGVANTMPVLAAHWRWLPTLDIPLDGGKSWRGKRILGDHKTVRGLVIGVLFGSITGYIQHLLFITQPVTQLISLISYRSALVALLLGAWLGFGGLLGDALKSFAKRQLNIPAGKPWRPFDQIDVVIGVLLVSIWFIPLTLAHAVSAVLCVWIISFVVSVIGVRLKIKKSI